MRFTSKQVVTMVVAVSAATVLAPVGVMAAAGQIVNIADPVLDRKVRVGSGGTLQVESRAGSMSGAFTFFAGDLTGDSGGLSRKVAETGYPNRIAITEVHAATRVSSAPIGIVTLTAHVRTSGSAPCGGAGWTTTVLTRFTLKPVDTVQMDFDGPPLTAPAPASGQRVCVLAHFGTYSSDTMIVDLGATGYLYS